MSPHLGFRDSAKENGNYCIVLWYLLGYEKGNLLTPVFALPKIHGLGFSVVFWNPCVGCLTGVCRVFFEVEFLIEGPLEGCG